MIEALDAWPASVRVIIVDDSPDDRADVRRSLLQGSDRRFAFEEAETGAAGVRAVLGGAAPPRCVILDFDLPDMGGLEVLRALSGPDGQTLCPVLVLTGTRDPEHGRQALRAGAQDFIGKDWLSPAALVRALENAVERWILDRELRNREAALLRRAVRDAFFVALSEATHGSIEPRAVKGIAIRLLGRHLGAGRVTFAEVSAAGEVDLQDGYVDGMQQLQGRFQARDFGGHLHDELQAGRTVVANDVHNGPAYDPRQRAAFAQVGLVAHVSVPLHHKGRLVAVLAVHQHQPREWTLDEIALIEHTARSVLGAVTQAQVDVRLRSSETRLRLALAAGGMGVWHWTPATGAGGADAALFALTGLDQDPAAHTDWAATFFRHVHPDDLPQVRALASRVLAGGGQYVHDFRLLRPDGRLVWLATHGLAVTDDAGGPAELVCVSFDVTARKQAEEAVRASEARMSELISLMPSFTAVLRGPDLRFELVNQPYCTLVGRTRDQLLGHSLLQALPEFADQPFPALLKDVMRTGNTFRADGMEALLHHADGRTRAKYLDFVYQPLRDGDQVTGVLIHGLDRTSQILAERALSRSQRDLQGMADNTPDILTRFDREFRHLFVNLAVERATGRSRDEFIGRTNRELGLPAALCDRWELQLNEVFITGRPGQMDFSFDGPVGVREFTAVLVPEFDAEGSVESVLGVTHDVTGRRQIERALAEQDRRKDEFLATLAHELRNPLAPVRNGLHILRKGVGPAQSERTLSMMDRQLGQLVRLVDDLLDVSRISSGKVTLQRERVSLEFLVNSASEAARPLIDAARHQFTVRLPSQPVWLDADPTRVAQVIGNLLSNSARYTPAGGRIALDVSVLDDRAVIEVTDSGVGIPPAMLARVFDMFTQVESAARTQGGLGIGLSLVKRFVELHGGTVDAQSGPGMVGSRFTVRLPLSSAVASVAARTPVRDLPAGTGRVLVVDDNADAAQTLAAVLELAGCTTCTAGNGPDALALASTFLPQVVLLDIGMPGMDGHEVARRLRGTPQLRDVFLVAVTGWGTEDDRSKSRKSGFDLHFTKPVDVAALVQVVTDALAARPRLDARH